MAPYIRRLREWVLNWGATQGEVEGTLPRFESLDEGGDGAAVDLYWLALGAGGHFVRLNGRLYEALAARLGHRRRLDLYHSALQVELPEVDRSSGRGACARVASRPGGR